MNLRPLSDLTNELSELAETKEGSLFTGSNFAEKYGGGRPHSSERDETLAYVGGDIHNAYSKVYSTYMKLLDTKRDQTNEVNVKPDSTLNTDVIIGDFEYADDHLATAQGRLEGLSGQQISSLDQQITEIRRDLQEHTNWIKETGVVVVE